jgi:Ca-activated chloride channel family protein
MERRRTQGIVFAAALCGAASLLAQSTPAPPAQDDQVFKADAELVVLHVNVFNGRSDAVPDLPQSAFTVYEDDRPQEISFFNAGDVPVTVGLVVDNSTSMLTERPIVLSGTTAFAESSHPEDQMFSVIFNEHVRSGLGDTLDFTTNRLQLRGSLQQYPAGGKTALYDAVIYALDHLDKGAYQKHVLVVMSDGGDNASSHTEKQMLDRVASSSAIIYTVVDPDVFSPGESRPKVLQRLAKLSGGVSYFPKNDKQLVQDFTEIAGNIRRGYSIGYVPSVAGQAHHHGEPHNVKVLVHVPGRHDLTVHVRNTYAEPDPADAR